MPQALQSSYDVSWHLHAFGRCSSPSQQPVDTLSSCEASLRPQRLPEACDACSRVQQVSDTGRTPLTCRMPFSLVQHVTWRALFTWLNSEARLQSKQSLKRDLNELHTSLQHSASSAFQAAETGCSIQTDVWTAAAGQLSFTGGNISWIDSSWKLHTDFGFFTPLRQRHTGFNLAAPLLSWLETRRLCSSVVSIATDGASNNLTMLERVSQTPSMTATFDNHRDHVLCACHSIGRVVFVFMKTLGCSIPPLRSVAATPPTLLLNDLLLFPSDGSSAEGTDSAPDDCPSDEEETDTSDVEKEEEGDEELVLPPSSPHGTSAHMARRFCKATMRSSHLVAAFKAEGKQRALKRVAGIRWANDVEVWQSVLAQREAVGQMLFKHASHYHGRHGIKLETADFLNLAHLVEILSPLRDATRLMEGSTPTGSSVLHMWLKLIDHLETKRSEFASSPDLVSALEAAIEKARSYLRKSAESRPILIATALNPQCRLRFFDKNECLGVRSREVKALLVDVCLQSCATEPIAVAAPQQRSRASASKFLDFGDESDEDLSFEDVLEDQISRYNRRKGVLPGSADFQDDPLRWWKLNGHLFPALAKLARCYLSVLASQAVTERLFSASAAVCNPRRMGNFHPETISTQVGTDQLLLNGYRATGGWGVAQGIIERHKQKENLAQKKARCAQDEAERSQGSAAGSSFAAM